MDDERSPGRIDLVRHHAGRCHLLSLEVGRVLAVAAEVAGQKDRIDFGRVQKRRDDTPEGGDVLLASSCQVDRVPRRGRERQHRRELCRDGLGKPGKLEPVAGSEVGRERAVTASISGDRDTPSSHRRADEEGLGEVDELAGRSHADRTRRPAGRVDGGEVAYQGTRVGQRRACARFARSDREDEHGFAGTDRVLGRPGEGAPVPEVLAVDRDHRRRLVIDIGAHDVGHLEVCLIPEGGEA